eukprot:gb/GEZN01003209.1/.p1 GENE.gb/GEZN01003209.1/~~gb/GEZN01003209.1/.p1  ORF type:complete len:629 (+),score=124.18 gb/GEZN01003209.1/:61-1947(+)
MGGEVSVEEGALQNEPRAQENKPSISPNRPKDPQSSVHEETPTKSAPSSLISVPAESENAQGPMRIHASPNKSPQNQIDLQQTPQRVQGQHPPEWDTPITLPYHPAWDTPIIVATPTKTSFPQHFGERADPNDKAKAKKEFHPAWETPIMIPSPAREYPARGLHPSSQQPIHSSHSSSPSKKNPLTATSHSPSKGTQSPVLSSILNPTPSKWSVLSELLRATPEQTGTEGLTAEQKQERERAEKEKKEKKGLEGETDASLPPPPNLSSPLLDVLPPPLWSLVLEYACKPEIVLNYYLECREGPDEGMRLVFVLRDDGTVWYTRPTDGQTIQAGLALVDKCPIFQTKVDFNHFMNHNDPGTWMFDVSLQRLLVGHLREVTPGLYQPLTYALDNSPIHHLTIKYRDMKHTVSVEAYPHARTPSAFKGVLQRLEVFEQQYVVPKGGAVKFMCGGKQHDLQVTRVKAGLSPWALEDIKDALSRVYKALDMDKDGKIGLADLLGWVGRLDAWMMREEDEVEEDDEEETKQDARLGREYKKEDKMYSGSEVERMKKNAQSQSTGVPPQTPEARVRELRKKAQKWSTRKCALSEETFVKNYLSILAGQNYDWSLFMTTQFPLCLLAGTEEYHLEP